MVTRHIAYATAVVVGSLAIVGVAIGGGGSSTVRKTVELPAGPPGYGHAKPTARCEPGRPQAIGLQLPQVESVAVFGQRLRRRAGFRVDAVNYGPADSTATVIGYCDADAPPLVARATTKVAGSDSPDTHGTKITARCHDDERLAFGGFELPRADDTNVYVAQQKRAGLRWTTKAFNFEDPEKVTSIAYCADRWPRLTTERESITVAPDSPAKLKVGCPAGKRALTGGYKGAVTWSDAFVLLRGMQRTADGGWRVSVVNENPSSSGGLTAWAYCA